MQIRGVVASILLSVVMLGASAEQVPSPDEVCVENSIKERVRSIMLDGIDEAMRKHTIHMFEVWLKDPTGQPRRARIGMRAGVNAYIGARKAALEWNPPDC